MTILVVDDNGTNLKLLRAVLEEEGYCVFAANDGLEALAVLEREPIDAVISDIHMPNMDGYRLCYEVRTSSRFCSLPFIVYTASYTTPRDEELALSFGVDKFIRKPASSKVIAQALQEVLKSERRQRKPINPPRELSLMKEYNFQLVAKLEEKNAELLVQAETLRQSASHKQAILDSALDCIITMDSDGRIVEFNRAAERTFGLAQSEALGAALDVLIIIPGLRGLYRRYLAHYQTGVEGPAFGKRLELAGLRKDGAEFPIELSIARIAATALPMFTVFVRDLTEQKRQQGAQLAAEAKFRRLVEQSITGIYVMQDDKFAYVNPKMAEIFGWTQEELTCKPLVDFVFEEDRHLVCKNVRERLAGAIESVHYTLRAVRKDGKLIYVEAHGGRTNNGRPAILGSLLDITERKLAEKQVCDMQEQLEQNNRELVTRNQEIQYFYHTLSHELKTPLTSAREFVSIVMDGLAGELNQTQSTYLGIAKESCTQLALYINDLLDATRLETGKLHVELKPASLAAIIQRAMATIKPAATQKKISLSENLDATLIDVEVDESRITQIIANLLNNALKFTPEGGAVNVTLRQDPKHPERVHISVTDNGCGIPKDKFKRVFDRLYQVNGSDATAHGGMGLGLYLCRELVLLHGGNIWVASEIGTGSTFTFDVPKRALTKGPHVLIVDDDDAIRESLRLILEEKHFEVTTAQGGNQALEIMDRNVPNIVVLDLLMAGLNGPNTLKEIRKRWGLIPVILYTGYPDGDLLAQSMGSSPFTVLTKPCPLKLFVATVRRLCAANDTDFLKKPKVVKSVPGGAAGGRFPIEG